MKTLWLTLLLALLAVGCKGGRTITSQPVLRLAMIPSTDPGKIVRESQPLVNYLERETGSRVELVVPTNYAALFWAIWPQARPLLSSYTVLRSEMNLRASTILGLVGGGVLGQAIYNNVQLGFYPRLSSLILPVYALVLTSDWIGERLR